MTVQTVLGPNGITLAVVPEDTKVDIRRFCGYPAYGPGTIAFFELGLFMVSFQVLEKRLASLTESEFSRITSLYLPNLLQLETDLFNLRNLVIVDKAAVFTRNANESKDRHNEFSYWRRSLCDFLGIDPGPQLRKSGNNIPIVLA